ncbi:MAG TPA: serine/threonine-protein kinase [Intrasporangium sp.]|uniref:serine/threonine-protein kinase n=1 Tax=Intrasporangium sp. TaxID=1925024 RepID=UPI002D7719EF|nr:serine/threonine-protein kinase [Intrasporangium sp.]HET7398828.1 serine/threonine-protein kinase [Intrasporangium sp.]
MSESHGLLAGRYRLMRRLGAGGMGVVWHAWDERLRRPVAVKQLHAQRGMTEAEAKVASDRAMREARINARLHHPHAVSVFDVVEHDGQPCLVMQYLPSRSLHAILAEKGRLPPREAARIGAQVASALAAAHEAGIVHRDVKPGNILVTEDGSARISDFGISHAVWDVTLTSTGLLAGTPAYLAPEVARGERSSFPSDVFSLGATLYAAVEGAPPFGTHENPMALLHQVASGEVLPPSAAGMLTPLLLRMLAPAPQDRPPMEEAALALEALASSPTPYAAGPASEVADAPGKPGTTASAPPDESGTHTTALPLFDGSADASSDAPADAPRRRGLLLALVALLVLAGAGLAVFVLGREAPGGPAAAQASAGSVTTHATSAPSRGGSATSAVPTAAAPGASATAAAPPPSTHASPSPAATSASTGPSTTGPEAGPPTAAELAQAIDGYYALVPGDTDAGWARLTTAYQRSTATSRQTYDAFWRSIREVAVVGASGSPPARAEATVTYTFRDGRVVRERTAYGLVREGGVLKINSSRVLRSERL